MNRRIQIPDKLTDGINRKVMQYITDEEQKKYTQHQGKVVYLDGFWYFIDMDMKKAVNGNGKA
jgi:uncharacterized protein YchJ